MLCLLRKSCSRIDTSVATHRYCLAMSGIPSQRCEGSEQQYGKTASSCGRFLIAAASFLLVPRRLDSTT
jgi:hypothetical protein